MRVETGETFSGEIPISLFRGSLFKQKLYLDKAVEIVFEGLEALNVKPSEELHVCTGYVLSRVRETLQVRGFIVVPSKIVGKTQREVEEAFVQSLTAMGIAQSLPEAGRRRFSSLLEWVHEDLLNREKYVKTGWPSWEKKLKRSESVGANS